MYKKIEKKTKKNYLKNLICQKQKKTKNIKEIKNLDNIMKPQNIFA